MILKQGSKLARKPMKLLIKTITFKRTLRNKLLTKSVWLKSNLRIKRTRKTRETQTPRRPQSTQGKESSAKNVLSHPRAPRKWKRNFKK
jgi:hypothetical protein